jgi:metallo-beta-lactamase class B
VTENGKTYNVVIIGSPNINPGYRLVNNRDYPQIAQDFATTFTVLKALPCDVFLGAHGAYYDMIGKYQRTRAGAGANPFVDPRGYKNFVAEKEAAFLKTLEAQRAEEPNK